MKKQTRMILLAALLSLTVFGGTKFWYQSQSAQLDQHADVKPLAFAASVHEDVRRRPASRLIWQTVNSGEALYPGEAIKTSAKSEVRIQFNDGNRYIDLDPDSLLVITSNNNEISLDLMDGSIFVAGGDKGATGPALTLNSAKGKVDLSGATASLSKSSSGVDVQVLKGKVTSENGQEFKNSLIDSVKILSPMSDHPTIINPESSDSIKFSWQGFPENTLVSLWVGSSRKEMKQIAQTKVPGQSSIEKRISTGKHFFKLIASEVKNPKNQMESQLHRFEVIAKFPPVAIYPTSEASLVMNKPLNPVSFKWSKPEDTKSVTMEISKDSSFKQKILSKDFNDEEDFTQDLAPGDYYWRLNARYDGTDGPITSKPIHFSITSKPKNPLKIIWLPKQEKEIQYFIEQASVNMVWDVDLKSDVKKWTVHLWPTKDGRKPAAETEKVIKTIEMKAQSEVPQAGSFNAMVEAFNENDVLLASSEVKTFEAAVKPLLEAPLFLPEKGELKADNRGNLSLKWTAQSEAKDYQLVLMDKDGNEIKRGNFTGTSTSLVNLMPGEYKVDIFATDIHGRESEHGTPRHVLVPDTSGLKAPKLKKVQVN